MLLIFPPAKELSSLATVALQICPPYAFPPPYKELVSGIKRADSISKQPAFYFLLPAFTPSYIQYEQYFFLFLDKYQSVDNCKLLKPEQYVYFLLQIQ